MFGRSGELSGTVSSLVSHLGRAVKRVRSESGDEGVYDLYSYGWGLEVI